MSQLNALRHSLKTAVQTLDLNDAVKNTFDGLRAQAKALDVNGNGTLATQEVSKSALTAEQKKVLSQAISRAANSEGGQSVENVQRWLSTFEADFRTFDTDGNGALTDVEISAADSFRQQAQLRAARTLVEKSQPNLWS